MTIRRLRLVLAALAALLVSLACSGGSEPNEPSDDFSGDSSSGGVVGSGGTGSGGTSSGGAATGGASPLGCAETELTFTFDDDLEESNVVASGTPSSLVLQTALPRAGVPNFTLAILGIDATAGAPLPLADGPRIDWSLASNGSALPSAIVSTLPSGANQLPGEVSGTLLLSEVGEVGTLRCGTLEFSLSYLDADEVPHSFSAEGRFQALLSSPEMP